MLKDPLSLCLVGLFLLLIGFCAGWLVKVVPEPEVVVRPLLKPPFVEVVVNGKSVDLSKIRLVPENDGKKKKSGEIGEVGEVVRPAAVLNGLCNNPQCTCGKNCDCKPCHCGVPGFVPTICVFASEPYIEPQFEQQRGGSGGKSAEAFGIETLALVLKEFKEALFGDKSKGTPGLRDDIAKGLGDFYGTLRTGTVVAGGVTLALVGWIAVSLHRIADHTTKAV